MPTEPPVKGERKRASFIHSRLRNRRMEQTRRSFTAYPDRSTTLQPTWYFEALIHFKHV